MDCSSCHSQNVENARFCAKCGALLPIHVAGESDPLIGQIIKNTFRVVRVIGEGGMGRVYEGEQQMGTKTRKIAIKTLHPDLSRDPQIVARFNRECGTVADLEHPNTIQFFDFGQTPDGTLFIAMEFLEGDSVAKILEKSGPMPPTRVEKIMRQICGSLAEAHQKGIVHRDLKPENVVLVTRAGETDFVKVLDFGIAARRDATDAKKEQKLTQQGMVLGTPPYMSPEQFKGQELDAGSDIYSLGVMAYEMLTSKLPFEAATPWEWATKHLTERPSPFEITGVAANIPANMKSAIMRALSKNRPDRQSGVDVFLAEMTGGAAPQPVATPAGSGTAQMAAPPPELLQVASGTPAMSPPMPAPVATPLQQQYAFAPAPAAASRQAPRSNTGLIVAIVTILGLGGIFGIIFVARALLKSSSSDEPPPISIVSSAPPTTVEPITSGGTTPTEETTASGKVPPIRPTATTTGTATASAGPPKGGLQGEEACRKAIQLANNEQIEAAVAMYRACQNGGQTAPTAHAAISKNAGPAARRAAFNHDCARAHHIADSAASIGAAGTSQAEAAKCK